MEGLSFREALDRIHSYHNKFLTGELEGFASVVLAFKEDWVNKGDTYIFEISIENFDPKISNLTTGVTMELGTLPISLTPGAIDEVEDEVSTYFIFNEKMESDYYGRS